MRHLPSCGRLAVAAMMLAAVHAAAAQTSDVANALSGRLAKRGFTPEQGACVMRHVAAAKNADLPLDTLVSRIDEGLAKQVSAEAMERAVQARLQALEAAKGILLEARYDDLAAESCRHLLEATGMALESGIARGDLRDITALGNGQFAMRMACVVEAGEALHLAGIGDATVKSVMADCLARKLCRMEILRAVAFCIQQHRSGKDDAGIRTALWESMADTNSTFRGPGGRRGGPGCGAGNGPIWSGSAR